MDFSGAWSDLGYGIESWQNMCLADFVSCYDLLSGAKKSSDNEDYRERILLNNKGKVRLCNKQAL